MMQDKNSREIHAGDIVEIRNAYFKNDNGFWYVEQDTTNEAYLDKKSITLKKISKRGKVSRSKYNLAFYPLKSYVNDRAKAEEADRWNKKNATIEIVDNVDKSEVIAEFEKEKAEQEETIRWHELRGYSDECLKHNREHLEYVNRTLERMKRA